MNKEQTTIRLPEELMREIKGIAEEKEMPLSSFLRLAARRIVNRYKFNEKSELIF